MVGAMRRHSWPHWSSCVGDANPFPRSSRALISWWTRLASVLESVSVAAAAQSCRQSVRLPSAISALPDSTNVKPRLLKANYHARILSCSLQIGTVQGWHVKLSRFGKTKCLVHPHSCCAEICGGPEGSYEALGVPLVFRRSRKK